MLPFNKLREMLSLSSTAAGIRLCMKFEKLRDPEMLLLSNEMLGLNEPEGTMRDDGNSP